MPLLCIQRNFTQAFKPNRVWSPNEQSMTKSATQKICVWPSAALDRSLFATLSVCGGYEFARSNCRISNFNKFVNYEEKKRAASQSANQDKYTHFIRNKIYNCSHRKATIAYGTFNYDFFFHSRSAIRFVCLCSLSSLLCRVVRRFLYRVVSTLVCLTFSFFVISHVRHLNIYERVRALVHVHSFPYQTATEAEEGKKRRAIQ